MPRRLSSVVDALCGVVFAHAVTGWLVHAIDHAGVAGHGHVHHVHDPASSAAGLVLVGLAAARLLGGARVGEGLLRRCGVQVLLVTGVVVLETVARAGAAHLLHDPWVAAAPLAVVVVHLVVAAAAVTLVAAVGWLSGLLQVACPPHLSVRYAIAQGQVPGRSPSGGGWGRAPPVHATHA